MKKINSLLCFFAIGVSLVSCLKDPKITDELLYGDEGIGKTAIIDIPAGPEGSRFIDNEDGTKTIDLIKFAYANENPAPQDVTIELEYDQSLLDAYNEDHDEAGFVIPDSDMYSLVNGMTVVIPRGERYGYFQINVTPSDFLGGEYAFPVRIKSVTPEVTLNSIRNQIVMVFGTKNKYDGKYQYVSSANTSLRPNSNTSAELHTAGANRLLLKPGLLAYYSNEVYYNIDPATNAVTVECPSLGVQTPQDPRSKYDPATKTLTVYWKQGNGGRTFEETLTYTGPR
ncbi:DUF1735 domain-containing protein [Niabella insulamsoli]|uniref:DUF1735 domain-containing protein n=1 Tax=Niabella insulamsoli TaxID=3144874 RepID=UPI0031FCBB77